MRSKTYPSQETRGVSQEGRERGISLLSMEEDAACGICSSDEGVFTVCSDTKHRLCQTCLQQELRVSVEERRKPLCPFSGSSSARHDVDLISLLSAGGLSPETISLTLKCVEQASASSSSRSGTLLERCLAAANIHCEACGTVLAFEVEGCHSVTCMNCRSSCCHFCGKVFLDAHSHVAVCKWNPKRRTKDYFGGPMIYKEGREACQAHQVSIFLASCTEEEQRILLDNKDVHAWMEKKRKSLEDNIDVLFVREVQAEARVDPLHYWAADRPIDALQAARNRLRNAQARIIALPALGPRNMDAQVEFDNAGAEVRAARAQVRLLQAQVDARQQLPREITGWEFTEAFGPDLIGLFDRDVETLMAIYREYQRLQEKRQKVLESLRKLRDKFKEAAEFHPDDVQKQVDCLDETLEKLSWDKESKTYNKIRLERKRAWCLLTRLKRYKSEGLEKKFEEVQEVDRLVKEEITHLKEAVRSDPLSMVQLLEDPLKYFATKAHERVMQERKKRPREEEEEEEEEA